MRAIDIIARKRDGWELTTDEIAFFIDGYCQGQIADYQAAAWLMAVCWRGMTDRETAELTRAMAQSGDTIHLGQMRSGTVDKHSTGGVGDKTTLIVAPTVAACGVRVGKMSGRGLGFSGGTLDKLESIPGYSVELTVEAFLAQLERIGIVIAGQGAELAPADGKLYALRDVTATVESIPLIASSIMSKKIAAGAPSIVLDVKYGAGAFMKTVEGARDLATAMVAIGRQLGRNVVTIISSMEQPLGRAVGNALEVAEAVETLRGHGPPDLVDLCLSLSAHMLVLGGKAPDLVSGRAMAADAIDEGRALEKLIELVVAQGGDPRVVRDPRLLPVAPNVVTLQAPQQGYVSAIDAETLARVAVELGAGRARKGDRIDHSVGLVLMAKVGNQLNVGDPLIRVHARSEEDVSRLSKRIVDSFSWSERRVELPVLIRDTIT
jgi:pyrimidine-nucleoside phosphorylase